MMLTWSHATDITNMGQFNHHFFTVLVARLLVICTSIKNNSKNDEHKYIEMLVPNSMHTRGVGITFDKVHPTLL